MILKIFFVCLRIFPCLLCFLVLVFLVLHQVPVGDPLCDTVML